MSTQEAFVQEIARRIDEAKQRPPETLEHHYIVVSLQKVRYAIPMNMVVEVVQTPALTSIPGAYAYIQGIFFHRGTVVPVIDLPKRFQSTHTSSLVPKYVLVIEKGSSRYGFLEDAVIDVVERKPEQIYPVSGEDQHLPTTYLLGCLQQQIPEAGQQFHYDFLIGSPSFQQQFQEETKQFVGVTTYVCSVPAIVHALEEDALTAWYTGTHDSPR
jgi:chemotaxis signal transduction protein